jgi:KUP system potassium uptake protein
VFVLTVLTEPVPAVEPERRFELTQVRPGFWRLVVRYGFMEDRDVPGVFKAATATLEPAVDPALVTYFLGREAVLGHGSGTMGRFAEGLFGYLQRNAVAADAAFGIPPTQAVEIGIQLDL